jgi:hypothetical protein
MEVLVMADRTFNLLVETNLAKEFMKKCSDNKVTPDDAIEQLIKAYLDGAIGIETKTVYSVAGPTVKQPKAKTKKATPTTEGKSKRGRKPKSENVETTTTETPEANLNE